MDYEWDERKRVSNIKKHHGVDFADAERFDWKTALVVYDGWHDEEIYYVKNS